MSNRLGYSSISTALRQLVEEKKIGIHQLSEISEHLPIFQQALVNVQVDGNLTVGDISQEIYFLLLESIQATGIPQNLRYVGTFNFVGRDETLTELHDLLQGFLKVAIASVSGMGGIGKTELALQYALRHLQDYPGGVCWLDDRGLDLGTQIIQFVITQLSLTPPEGLDSQGKVEWCWRHWKPDGKVLLLVDDVTNYKEVLKWLPKHEKRFRVVMTSREKPGRNIRELKLIPLSPEAALKMLSGLVGIEKVEREKEIAQQICSWLGYLPLGLELVGHYVYNSDLPLVIMLGFLKEKRLAAHALLVSEADMTAGRGVVEAFELSWEVLTPDAKKLAAFLSLFSLTPIFWTWIEICLKTEEQEDLIQALETLTRQHIVQIVGQRMYQLHPLIREFLRDKLQKLNDAEIIMQTFCHFQASLADTIPFPYLFSRELEEDLVPLIPHLEEVATSLVAHLSREDLVKPFRGLARFYQAQSTYNLAEDWLKKGFSTCQNFLGLMHESTASIIKTLAFLYYLEYKHDDAEPLCRQALELQKNLLGEKCLEVADTIDDLAKIMTGKERFIEAESLYLQALKIRRDLLGEKHIDIAISLGNIAKSAARMGLYLEAERYYLEAIDIKSNLNSLNKINLAFSFSSLSLVYIAMNRYSDVERLLNRILELRETYWKTKHPFAERIVSHLAMVYKYLGKSSEAKFYLEEALDILTKTLGSDHKRTVNCKNQLQELLEIL